MATLYQWAAEGRLRTVVMDGVKKASVVDVVCAAKACNAATARNTYALVEGRPREGPFPGSRFP